MEKTIDNSFIEEREILIRVFSGYRRWNRVEKEEYTLSISFLISLLVACKWTFMSDEYQISLCSGKLVQ